MEQSEGVPFGAFVDAFGTIAMPRVSERPWSAESGSSCSGMRVSL